MGSTNIGEHVLSFVNLDVGFKYILRELSKLISALDSLGAILRKI
jgi:hypothetical protein